jgi:ribosomal protein L22
MSPKNPQDPQKGKPMEDVQAAEEAKESTPAKAVEDAQAAEATEAPAEKPKQPRAKKPAAATAAEETGADKQGAAAAKPARTRKPATAGADEPKAEPKTPARGKTPARESARPRRAGGRAAEPAVVVRAQAKYVRTSARKARLVCDHIRGKDVAEARAILAFTPRQAAKAWSKLLESAIANAENNHELVGEQLRIHSVVADEGPTLKRFRPRAMGRATRIRKRTSHLTITLTPKES